MSNNHPHVFQILTAIAVTLCLLFFLILGTLFLKIQQVICVMELEGQNCPSEVITAFNQLRGNKLLFNNGIKQIQELGIISQHFQVLNISKTILGVITIEIKPLDAAYSLITEDITYLVTDQGTMMLTNSDVEQKTMSDCSIVLPKVEDVSNDIFKQAEMKTQLQVNQSLHQEISSLIQGLNYRSLQCDKVNVINQNSWILALSSSKQIVLNPDDLDSNLNRLVQVLDVPIPNEYEANIPYLDVRFSMPVLRKSL